MIESPSSLAALQTLLPNSEVWQEGESWLLFDEHFADEISFQDLDKSITWKQDSMKIYGKDVKFPRLTAWYGDEGTDYKYSGIVNAPLPWTPLLEALRNKLIAATQKDFNAVLANRYADGEQHMGYHSDSEPEFGPSPIIASLSFGGTRKFLWKRKGKGHSALKLSLTHGSLLLMGGAMQEEFIHAVPKTKARVDSRINLTFRLVSKPIR